MAESPVLANGFIGAFGNFHGGTFTNAERQVLLLTNAVRNGHQSPTDSEGRVHRPHSFSRDVWLWAALDDPPCV